MSIPRRSSSCVMNRIFLTSSGNCMANFFFFFYIFSMCNLGIMGHLLKISWHLPDRGPRDRAKNCKKKIKNWPFLKKISYLLHIICKKTLIHMSISFLVFFLYILLILGAAIMFKIIFPYYHCHWLRTYCVFSKIIGPSSKILNFWF